MRTRSRSPIRAVEKSSDPPLAAGETASEAPKSIEKETEIERLNLPIKDGRVHWDGMRESTKEKAHAILGLGPGATSASQGDPIPPFVVPAICQALASLATLALVRVTKAPIAIVAPIAAFTDKEQDAIGPPMIAVLNKYLGASVTKYGDELALVMLLYAIGQQKIALVHAAVHAADVRATKDVA
jgi:hypothetical protein